MEGFVEQIGWPIFICFLLIHITLLALNRKKALLITSQVMAGFGALALITGLLFYLWLGVYGVVVLLFGMVFYTLTKDHLENR